MNQIDNKCDEELIKSVVAIKCSFLKHLNLSWNKIGDRDVEELCKAIVNQMRFLQNLNLS